MEPVRYISTRGGVPPVGFEQALFAGLAADGGLYLPDHWPRLGPDRLEALQGAPFEEVAQAVLTPFLGDELDAATFRRLLERSYAGFAHRAVAPLRQIDARLWLLELFHGPTLAFKDVAMQLLGRLFEHFLERSGRRITIVGATSGDTGAAAVDAFADRANVAIVVLHPHGRISEVQRRQMTTVQAANVVNIAVQGTFDDCQRLLKALFADPAFRDEVGLAAVNSINWARVMAQVVYFVTSALALGAPWRRIAYSVPTGNFGDVYAGYVAHMMGLPVQRLVVGTNQNDILARFFATGTYRLGEVRATMSPSMDIQVASNFERLLFELCAHDGEAVQALMGRLADARGFDLAPELLGRARELFEAERVDEDATARTIKEIFERTGMIIDPHTAVGVAAARPHVEQGVPMVVLSTAHPAKFPEAIRRSIGVLPPRPARVEQLLAGEERYEVLSGDLAAVKARVRQAARAVA